MPGSLSIMKTPTYKSRLCQKCLDPIRPDEQTEIALDRHNTAVGLVHSGHCAHQWRLHIEGAEAFRGRG